MDKNNSEKYLEKKLVSELKKYKSCKCLKYTSHNVVGYPDRLILLPGGRCIWVEIKSKGRTLSEIQKVRVKELRDMGHTVCVVDDEETLGEVIQKIKGLE